MKAMIMAAGYGERMRPLSDRRPKPLLPVLGRPLIDHVVKQLMAAGIAGVGVNTHHQAQRVVAHLRKHFSATLEMIFSHEDVIRGTGGGMRGLGDFLSGDDPFLVHNGDVFSTVPISDVVAFHRRQAPLVTLVLVDYPPVNSVTLSDEGAVIDFHTRRNHSSKPNTYRTLTFSGISVVDPAVLDLIPDTIPYSIIDVYKDLIKAKPGSIQGFVPHHAYWIDVGTPAAYLRIHRELLLHGEASVPGYRGSLTGVYQGAECLIDSSAQFHGFVSLGKNCRVEANVSLGNCIVWDDSVVESGTHFENGVIDGTWSYRITET